MQNRPQSSICYCYVELNYRLSIIYYYCRKYITMKKAIVFKTLIDVFYIFHIGVPVYILLIVPLEAVKLDTGEAGLNNWTFKYWALAIVSSLTYVIFLRGLYFLRKVARRLLSRKYFSEEIITHLRKSGMHFLIAGSIFIFVQVLLWLSQLFVGQLNLSFEINSIAPLFLVIIGLFFIIQSNALLLAKDIKAENDLTV